MRKKALELVRELESHLLLCENNNRENDIAFDLLQQLKSSLKSNFTYDDERSNKNDD